METIGGRGRWREVALALMLIVVAVLLRWPGFDGRMLWVDELWRANLILEPGGFARYWSGPDLAIAITAPLYMAINVLVGAVSSSPWCLRLSSLLPGLISVVLAFAIARRAGGGLVWACGAAALFAVNSHFILYSNEFKPYMFEVMVHLAVLYFWLILIGSGATKPWQWAALCGVLVVALLCAANAVFVLPAMAVSLLDKVWAREQNKFRWAVGTFVVVGVVALGMYLLVWSFGSDKGLINYWAEGFYDATRERYLTFAISRLRGLWSGGFAVVGTSHGMLLVSGLGSLCALYMWGRRGFRVTSLIRGLIIYGLTLLLTLLALNRMGLWPIGEIRPNLFLFAIGGALWILLVGCVLPLNGQRLIGGLAIVVMAVGVSKISQKDLKQLAPPIEQSDRVWAAFAASAPAGKMVVEECRTDPVPVFLNPAMSQANQYFAAFGGGVGMPNVLMDQCTVVISVPDAYATPETLRRHIAETLQGNRMHWHAYSHLNREEVDLLKAVAREFGTLTYERSFENAGYFAVSGKEAIE